MERLLVIILGVTLIIGAAVFVYIFQKKDEENQELKNIMLRVHGKAMDFKKTPAYAALPTEARNILEYVETTTSLTTVVGPTYNPLKEIKEIMCEKK